MYAATTQARNHGPDYALRCALSVLVLTVLSMPRPGWADTRTPEADQPEHASMPLAVIDAPVIDAAVIDEIVVRASRNRPSVDNPQTELSMQRPEIKAPGLQIRLGYDAERWLENNAAVPRPAFDERSRGGVAPAPVIQIGF